MDAYENITYPNGANIIDVTKAPYFLDNTGKEDCTATLCKILNEILAPVVRDIGKLYEELHNVPDGTWIGKSNRKMNGKVYAIQPYINQPPTIYFPEGVYLISDTVTYTLEGLHNMMYHFTSGGMELNRCIRIMGQNSEKTVLKLKDYCKGFEKGQKRPVLSLMNGERSNVAMSNYVENLTIDVGKGNPGAVGLVFFANNSGAVRRLNIVSSDEHFAGEIGLDIRGELCSGCNIYDTSIIGFKYGIYIESHRTTAHFERITLNDCQNYGIIVPHLPISVIGLKAHLNVPAVFVAGPIAQLVLCDADIQSIGTNYPAVKIDQGCVTVKNLHTKGFVASIERCWGDDFITENDVKFYCNMKTFVNGEKQDVHLSVPDMPKTPQTDYNNLAFVNDFGAKGDFKTDDTEAIQAAFNSGRETIWFKSGNYLITKTISIPATVQKICFQYCDIINGEDLRNNLDGAVFSIDEDSDKVLYIEKLFSWDDCHGEIHMFRHNCKRTVFFRDMHTQGAAFYKNTVSGGVAFFENVACTIYKKELYSHISGFECNGNTCWCHGINPERSKAEVVNNGGTLWWSGFKTEQEGSVCVTENGGISEILGGVAVSGTGCDIPLIENNRSTVSASLCCTAYHDYSEYPVAVCEKTDSGEIVLKSEDMPVRYTPWYFIPFYLG